MKCFGGAIQLTVSSVEIPKMKHMKPSCICNLVHRIETSPLSKRANSSLKKRKSRMYKDVEIIRREHKKFPFNKKRTYSCLAYFEQLNLFPIESRTFFKVSRMLFGLFTNSIIGNKYHYQPQEDWE